MLKVATPGTGKRRGRPSRTITDKQAVWIAEYLKDMNGARAAEVAGYSHPNVAAAKLLNPDLYPHVVEAVQTALAEKRAACGIEARRIVAELAPIGFFNPKRLLDSHGTPLPLLDLPDEVVSALSEVAVAESRLPDGTLKVRTSVKVYNKLNALRQIAELLGYLRPQPHPPLAPSNDTQGDGIALTDDERREAIMSILRTNGHADGGPGQTDNGEAVDVVPYGLRELTPPENEDYGSLAADLWPLDF